MTHGLSTKNRADHLRRRIRGPLLPPESLGAADARTRTSERQGDQDADSVVVPLQAARPRRDGTTRIGAVVPLDSDKHASVVKPLAAPGWDNTTKLVAARLREQQEEYPDAEGRRGRRKRWEQCHS